MRNKLNLPARVEEALDLGGGVLFVVCWFVLLKTQFRYTQLSRARADRSLQPARPFRARQASLALSSQGRYTRALPCQVCCTLQ